jgi:beta-mannosidase
VKFIWTHRFFSSHRRWLIFQLLWALLFIVSVSLTILFHHSPAVANLVQTVGEVDRTGNRVVSLDGKWQFARGYLQPNNAYLPKINDRHWQSLTVPSNWFLQGQDFSGDTWYRRHFQIDLAFKDKLVRLIFEGVDYASDVWLNGHHLGFHEGYFQPFSFQVSKYLNYNDDNVLVVKVNSPFEEPGKVWSLHKRIIKGIFSHHDTRPGGAWSIRGQEQNTGGIWGSVSLQITDRVAITQQQVTPKLTPNLHQGTAHLDLTIINSTPTAQKVKLSTQLQPANFSERPDAPIVRTSILQPGVNHLSIDIPKNRPHLWWTWEHGRPDLYKLKTQILAENKLLAESVSTGFG